MNIVDESLLCYQDLHAFIHDIRHNIFLKTELEKTYPITMVGNFDGFKNMALTVLEICILKHLTLHVKYILTYIDKKQTLLSHQHFRPFRFVASTGNQDVLKLLFSLKNHLIHTIIRTHNYRIFLYACEYGHINVLKYLFKISGINEDKALSSHKYSALKLAFKHRHLCVINHIIKGDNAFEYALKYYDLFEEEIMRFLPKYLSLVKKIEQMRKINGKEAHIEFDIPKNDFRLGLIIIKTLIDQKPSVLVSNNLSAQTLSFFMAMPSLRRACLSMSRDTELY